METAAVVVLSAVAGLLLGGFLNVLVDRVPDRLPLRGGRHEHEPCAPMGAVLPMQPWLVRRGRCPDGTALPRRYLAVELVTAALFAVAGLRYSDSTALFPILVLVAALVTTSTIDLQVQRIPDRIVFPALLISLVLVVAVAIERDATSTIKGALIGAATYFLLLFPFNLMNPRWMGFGDVKLALLMGLFLGWVGWSGPTPTVGAIRMVFYGTMIGMLIGVVGGLVLTGFKMRRHFPLGPFIAAGTLVVVLFASAFQY